MVKEAAKGSPWKSEAVIGSVEFTIGDESGDAINVAIQVLSPTGKDITEKVALRAYVSGASSGLTLATAPTTLAIGTNGLAIEPISNSLLTLVTNAAGQVDITIGKSGAATYYLVVILPNGTIQVSPAITFAA